MKFYTRAEKRAVAREAAAKILQDVEAILPPGTPDRAGIIARVKARLDSEFIPALDLFADLHAARQRHAAKHN